MSKTQITVRTLEPLDSRNPFKVSDHYFGVAKAIQIYKKC